MARMTPTLPLNDGEPSQHAPGFYVERQEDNLNFSLKNCPSPTTSIITGTQNDASPLTIRNSVSPFITKEQTNVSKSTTLQRNVVEPGVSQTLHTSQTLLSYAAISALQDFYAFGPNVMRHKKEYAGLYNYFNDYYKDDSDNLSPERKNDNSLSFLDGLHSSVNFPCRTDEEHKYYRVLPYEVEETNEIEGQGKKDDLKNSSEATERSFSRDICNDVGGNHPSRDSWDEPHYNSFLKKKILRNKSHNYMNGSQRKMRCHNDELGYKNDLDRERYNPQQPSFYGNINGSEKMVDDLDGSELVSSKLSSSSQEKIKKTSETPVSVKVCFRDPRTRQSFLISKSHHDDGTARNILGKGLDPQTFSSDVTRKIKINQKIIKSFSDDASISSFEQTGGNVNSSSNFFSNKISLLQSSLSEERNVETSDTVGHASEIQLKDQWNGNMANDDQLPTGLHKDGVLPPPQNCADKVECINIQNALAANDESSMSTTCVRSTLDFEQSKMDTTLENISLWDEDLLDYEL